MNLREKPSFSWVSDYDLNTQSARFCQSAACAPSLPLVQFRIKCEFWEASLHHKIALMFFISPLNKCSDSSKGFELIGIQFSNIFDSLSVCSLLAVDLMYSLTFVMSQWALTPSSPRSILKFGQFKQLVAFSALFGLAVVKQRAKYCCFQGEIRKELLFFIYSINHVERSLGPGDIRF